MFEKFLIIVFGEKIYKIRTSWIPNFPKIVKRPWTFIRTPRVCIIEETISQFPIEVDK